VSAWARASVAEMEDIRASVEVSARVSADEEDFAQAFRLMLSDWERVSRASTITTVLGQGLRPVIRLSGFAKPASRPWLRVNA
jgi:hypothetical protein